ncbi:hypothetical protein N1I87_12995 [Bacillus sp. FSL W8-0102]|uniref:hypothetical protein n=1 Tax=Bacillus sp. FSL W8-0102 TaxID=2978205 RepID=UPI0030F8B9A2
MEVIKLLLIKSALVECAGENLPKRLRKRFLLFFLRFRAKLMATPFEKGGSYKNGQKKEKSPKI